MRKERCHAVFSYAVYALGINAWAQLETGQ